MITDAECDGINFCEAETDGSDCNGLVLRQDTGAETDGADCDLYASRPDSVLSRNPPPQEPEWIIVQHDGDDTGNATCEVDVYLETDLHKGQSDFSADEPESCDDAEDLLVFRPASCTVLKQEPKGTVVTSGGSKMSPRTTTGLFFVARPAIKICNPTTMGSSSNGYVAHAASLSLATSVGARWLTKFCS